VEIGRGRAPLGVAALEGRLSGNFWRYSPARRSTPAIRTRQLCSLAFTAPMVAAGAETGDWR
jgi:hypothetical protein